MYKLIVIDGPLKGRAFDLDEDTIFIGRSAKNHIQIKDGAVSRQQLKISKIGDKFFLKDLQSTNGTRMNGQLVPSGESIEVTDRDVVSIANMSFRLCEISYAKALGVTIYKEKQHGLPMERRSQSSKDLELVNKVSGLLSQPLDIHEVFEKILEYLLDTLPRIDRVAMLLFDTKRGQMKEIISRSREGSGRGTFTYSRTVVDEVLRDGKAVCKPNTADAGEEGYPKGTKSVQIGSVMCVPVISEGNVLGAIYLDSIQGPYGFREEDLLLLSSLAGPLAVTIQKAMLASRLEKTLSEIKIVI